MYDYIKGTVAELTPTYAVIDAGGLGFMLNISLNSYSAIQGKAEARLYVYEAIREDAFVLYGFATKVEREAFTLLIGVSGVGAGTARVILSALKVDELHTVIATGDVAALKSVKGIGAKTAQRIIVDLKDKIKGGDDTLLSLTSGNAEVRQEAAAALAMLGFQPQAVSKALQRLFAEEPSLTAELAVKKALKML